MEMFSLQTHFGAHLHDNSFRTVQDPRSLQLWRKHFKGAILIIQSPLFSLNFKAERGDLKWYGVGKWWNCNFRYKIPSIMCMGKHSHSMEQICLLRMIIWLAGRNKFHLKISLSSWGLNDNLAQSPPLVNGANQGTEKENDLLGVMWWKDGQDTGGLLPPCPGLLPVHHTPPLLLF